MSYLRNDLPGEKLIKRLPHLTISIRIHQGNNQIVVEGVRMLMRCIEELSNDGDVVLQIWRGRFFIQGEKIVYRRDTVNIIGEMLEYFTRRGLGGLCFLPSAWDADHESVVTFIRLMNECVKHSPSPAWLDLQLGKSRLSWVEILQKHDEGGEDDVQKTEQTFEPSAGEMASRAYLFALDTMEASSGDPAARMGGIRKARRLVQTIVDMAQEDSSLLLGLATAKDFNNFTYVHSVNVALLATCLGRRVGLSRVLLEALALCALYHDLGRLKGLEENFLDLGGAGSDESGRIKRHPLVSMREVLKMGLPQSLRARIIPGIFEHHLTCGLKGTPSTHFVDHPSLFGKILHIADMYESLTSETDPAIAQSLTPDEALRHMWSERGKNYDPLLMKHFVTMMGLYPIGTIVELNTGEKGVVMDYLNETDKTLPYVMLLKNDGKGGFSQGEKIDLASLDKPEGRPVRSIVKTLHFSELGINPSEFFHHGVGAAFDLPRV
jgi:HD-GYP domain-containing protein (c-di-GMP phosphodiesterase class II)